jgi:hypothetical protein
LQLTYATLSALNKYPKVITDLEIKHATGHKAQSSFFNQKKKSINTLQKTGLSNRTKLKNICGIVIRFLSGRGCR